jgi:hypothetical protein
VQLYQVYQYAETNVEAEIAGGLFKIQEKRRTKLATY